MALSSCGCQGESEIVLASEFLRVTTCRECGASRAIRIGVLNPMNYLPTVDQVRESLAMQIQAPDSIKRQILSKLVGRA